jgi:TetR/AcrR family transcriptional regulator
MMNENKRRIKWMEDKTENPLLTSPELLNSALDLFSQYSYKEASLNSILQKTGIHKGSFYYRFYDKMDLYLSVLHWVGLQKMKILTSYADAAPPSQDFFSVFKTQARLGLEFARMDKRYSGLWRRLLSEEQDVRSVIASVFGEMSNDYVSALIENSKKNGTIRSDVSTRSLAVMVTMMLERIDLLVSPDSDDEIILSEIDKILCVLQKGVCP